MKDFDSHVDRDNFYEKIIDSVAEFINDYGKESLNFHLNINPNSLEIQICANISLDSNWDQYNMVSLIRYNESENVNEVNIDKAYDIANIYFFVR